MLPLDTALSGIQSAHARMAVSAHNVANLGTEGVRPLYARQLSRSEGGSEVHLRQGPKPKEVNLARELVDQKLAQHQAEASARVVKTMDDMLGTLVDEFA